MNKTKVFYSYCHDDSEHKTQLDKWLSILKDKGVIETWHDREILAGEQWQIALDKHLEDSDIVLFLITVDFLNSEACKKELNQARKLNKIIIPIILDRCPWGEFLFDDKTKLCELEALPVTTDGKLKPLLQWDNQSEAWNIIYESLKKILDIENKVNDIKVSEEFARHLSDCVMFSKSHSKKENLYLEDIFVYPELTKQREQQNRGPKIVSSEKILDYLFEEKRLHIAGDDQSGKTSLCKMIFRELTKKKYFPVFLDSHKGGPVKNRIADALNSQYEIPSNFNIALLEKKIIPIVDDFHEAKNKEKVISELLMYPVHIIVTDPIFALDFNDKNLDEVRREYSKYEIQEYSASYRDKLIRKWLSVSDIPNGNDFYQELDTKTALVDSTLGKILGSGIMPSYPFWVLSIVSFYETGTKPLDQQITSQGHCYQSFIYLCFRNNGIKNEDFDTHINFLSALAFYIFNKKIEDLTPDQLEQFIEEYKQTYVLTIKKKILLFNLEESGIFVRNDSNNYYFHYAYLFHYFVGKYLADNLDEHKQTVDVVLANLHKNENAYIAIFISHHSKDQYVLDEIWLNANCLFEKHLPATLNKEEVAFMDEKVKEFLDRAVLAIDNKPEKERRRKLESQDIAEKEETKKSKLPVEQQEDHENELVREIRRSIKTAEVMGHIIKNRIGSLPKNKVKDIFESAMNIYFRLLSSYFKIIRNEDAQEAFIGYLQKKLDYFPEKERIRHRTKEEKRAIAEEAFWKMNFEIIFGVVSRVVFSLGSDKLSQIAEEVHKETDEPISFLVKHGIQMAHKKNIDADEIHKEMKRTKFSRTATAAIKHMVAYYCRFHKIGYKEKQRISNKLKIALPSHNN